MTTAAGRTARRGRVSEAAAPFDGVISRAELRSVGVGRDVVAREVAAGRWRAVGRETVAVHTGPIGPTALGWRALWEVGAGAALDRASALHAAGLTGFTTDRLDVSVPHPLTPRRVPGIRIHRVRQWALGDVIDAGQRRTRPEVAAVRAASWAASDRQAALVLCLVVQQRLVNPSRLLEASQRVRVRARREVIRQLVRDVTDGAQALGELDVARLCRRRGLPEPSRQEVRQGPRGRIYLDVRWDGVALVVEIDGAQHRQGLAVSEDNLRRNALAIEGEVVLTIDLVGLRLRTREFLDQVEAAYRLLAARRAA